MAIDPKPALRHLWGRLRAVAADHLGQAGTTLVPLFRKSGLSARTWLVIGVLLLLAGSAMVMGAMTAGKTLGAAGVVVLLTALAVCCRGLTLMTQKVRLAGDHIARITALSRCKMTWGQVELYCSALRTDRKPHHAVYRLEGAGGRIRFLTRADAYEDLDGLLRDRCARAFFLDCRTGWITPPAAGRSAAAERHRFRRVAARASRRYTFLAVVEVVALPVIFIAAGLAVLRIARLPTLYGLTDVKANLRRAAAARRSFAQYQKGE